MGGGGGSEGCRVFVVAKAPWHAKHCWCTPQGILDILKKHDASSLHKKECSEAANFDFEQPGPRRLRQSSQKVRIGCTPWALVSVPKTDTFDSLEGHSPESDKQISCAYQHGAPAASSNIFYQVDEPLSGHVGEGEGLAKEWGNASTRPCWVRVRGEGGERLASCAVALEKPGTLKDFAEDMVSGGWMLSWFFLCFAVLCTGVFAASSYSTISHIRLLVSRNREQRERGAQQESLMSNQ